MSVVVLFPALAAAQALGPNGTMVSATPAPAVKPLSQTPSPNVTIVNGQKFYSLTNARRFTASGPSALQVIHHPRPPATVVSNRNTVMPTTAVDTKAPAASTNPVLSVFAPEDKGLPATAQPQASVSADPIKAVAPPAPAVVR
jgi:hypothetical protein